MFPRTIAAILFVLTSAIAEGAFFSHSDRSQAALGPPASSSGSSSTADDLFDALRHLHRSLVEIESITGNEGQVGEWLASFLAARNFTVERQEVAPARFNVLAYPGAVRFTPVLLTSHIDTVPPFIPYAYYPNGTVAGRGSVDAKACVAAQIIAVLDLLASDRIDPDLVSLLFVVGEEAGGDGMLHFSKALENLPVPHQYDTVIFGEPTDRNLASGHKGMLGFEMHVSGKAAHSGYPWLGLSANNVLVEALGELLRLEAALPASRKYGKTTLNVGRIEGGVASNVVAQSARAAVAVRLAGGTPQQVQATIRDALEPIRQAVVRKGGDLSIKWRGEDYPPVEIDCDVDGFDCTTVNYGTDIPHLNGTHKRYLYGPGSILVAHSDHEALHIKELESAVEDYERLLLTAVERL